MRTKVKLTKQKIKEDKFTNYMLQSREWFLVNWQVVSIAAAAVIVVIVGAVYFFGMQEGKEAESLDRLNRAVAEARRQNYQVAILELKSIADSYGGSVGGLALFNLANAYYESKNYDEALNAYQQYADKYRQDKLMTSSAIAGAGACLENKQQFQPAGEKFLDALKFYPESPAAPDYYLSAIRNYVSAGDRGKVDSLLDEMKEKFPGTEYFRIATRYAMTLRLNS